MSSRVSASHVAFSDRKQGQPAPFLPLLKRNGARGARSELGAGTPFATALPITPAPDQSVTVDSHQAARSDTEYRRAEEQKEGKRGSEFSEKAFLKRWKPIRGQDCQTVSSNARAAGTLFFCLLRYQQHHYCCTSKTALPRNHEISAAQEEAPGVHKSSM